MTKAQIASWRQNAGKRLLKRVGVTAGTVVLDFGCREGNYTKIAADIVGATGLVYALDRKPDVLDELIRSARQEGFRNVARLETSGNMPLPLPDASVDVVLAYDVLHMIGWSGESDKTIRRSTASDRRVVLRELLRVLRPGGVLSAYCPHLASHTDVHSQQDIAKELESEGFDSRDGFDAELVHDSEPVQGHVMHFIKPAGVNRNTRTRRGHDGSR